MFQQTNKGLSDMHKPDAWPERFINVLLHLG